MCLVSCVQVFSACMTPGCVASRRHTLVRVLSDGTERPITDSEVSRLRHGAAHDRPAHAERAAGGGPEAAAGGRAAPALATPAADAGSRAAPALATPAAGAAAKALARLPEPAALRFLRQMRPGAAEAALVALQARAPEGACAVAGYTNPTIIALLPMWVVRAVLGTFGDMHAGQSRLRSCPKRNMSMRCRAHVED